MTFNLGSLIGNLIDYLNSSDWNGNWTADWNTKVYTVGGQAWTLGSGSDKALFKEWAASVDAGLGSDTITLEKGAGSVNLGGVADWSSNTLNLKGGWDNLLVGSSGKDTINIAENTGIDQGNLLGGDDTVTSKGWISFLDTGTGNDRVQIDGLGADTVKLGDGADSATSNSFVTFLEAGAGNDRVQHNAGASYTDLGTGDDVFVSNNKWAGDVSGGDGNDLFDINAGGNVYAGAGNDVAYDGKGGVTNVYGEDGNDAFVWDGDSGAAAYDSFNGGGGVDKLVVDLDWCSGPSKADVLKDFGINCASAWQNTFQIDTGCKVSSKALSMDVQGVEYIQFV